MKTINIKLPPEDIRDGFIFNNMPTPEDINQARVEFKIIVVHVRKGEVLEIHEILKNLQSLEPSMWVTVWSTSFTQEEFEEWFCTRMVQSRRQVPVEFSLGHVVK